MGRTWRKGNSWENGSLLDKRGSDLQKWGHIWKNGSHLKRWVTPGKLGHT